MDWRYFAEQQIARLTAKADELLIRGDTLGAKSAEGRRLLRECRRYRLRVKTIRASLSSERGK